MAEISPGYIGILLIIAAVALAVIVYLSAQLMGRKLTSDEEIDISSAVPMEHSGHEGAVLLVKNGGILLYANQKTRELFNLKKKELSIERLAQRTYPEDIFLGLCAAEGRARFTINGRLTEATSFAIPWSENGKQDRAILISLHLPQITSKKGGHERLSEGNIGIIAEINQAMVSSLDLEETINAIFLSVKRLISFDFAQIKLITASNRPPISYIYSEENLAERNNQGVNTSARFDPGYTDIVLNRQTPLLVPDINAFREVRPKLIKNRYPVNSYLGVPLILAEELIGALEIVSLSTDAFNKNDQEILLVIAGQAAVAVHSALLFQDEQKRILELSGLAKLAQAVGALRDQQDLFARLVGSIKPLMDVDVLGFLIYEESRQQLSAQFPFIGVPDDFIPLYKIDVNPNSMGGSIWSSNKIIESTNPLEDQRLRDLGVTDMIQAISIRNTVFFPLTSVGGNLGYLQVANKKDGSPIDQDDIRLLTIVAGQAATIIENATLLQQSQERAQMAEALRRIATLTGSVATLDEILSFSLRELARLLDADVGIIMLLDENRAELSLHKASLYGISDRNAEKLGRISMSDPDYRATVTGSQRGTLSENIHDDAEIIPIYLSIVKRLKLKSFVDVPIVVREGGVGELFLGSHKANFFNKNDLTMLVTAAGQLAAALEKSILYAQTDETLRRRVEQLLAITRVGRELNTHLDLEHPLNLIYKELLYTTQAQCGSLLIFNFEEESSGVQNILVQFGDSHPESLSEVESFVVDQGETLTIHDYAHIPDNFVNIDVQLPHENIRSSLIVPIRYREQTAGLIHLHSKEPGAFDGTALEIAQSLATQAAIALGNALRYQEQVQRTDLLNRRVETLERLLDTSRSLSPDQPLEKALEAIAYGIQETTPFNVVLMSMYKPEDHTIVTITGAGLPLESLEELRQQIKPWREIEELKKADFRYGHIYFIPYDQKPVTLPDFHTPGIKNHDSVSLETTFQWHPDDLLLLPLISENGEPLGIIRVDEPRNNLRPDRPAIDALEIFASQAILTIENQKRLELLAEKALSIESELQQTQLILQENQKRINIQDQMDEEQADAIGRLEIKFHRYQAGLEIIEAINQQITRKEVLSVIGDELINRMDVDSVLVADNSQGKPKLFYSLGSLADSQINIESLFGQRNPLRAVLENGTPSYASNLDENNVWYDSPLIHALEIQAFLCFPIYVNGKLDTAVLVLKREPYQSFNVEDENLFSLIFRQAGVTLERLHLLSESNQRLHELDLLLDFSRELGTLNPKNILHALLDSSRRAVPSARAGFVALWNEQQQSLIPQIARGYREDQKILDIAYGAGKALPGQVFDEGKSKRIDEIDFTHQYYLSPDALLIYKDATGGLLPISALIVPIKAAEKKLGILMLENFEVPRAFSAEDQVLITSLVNQTALALENARLYQASEERSLQLQGLTRIASTITSSLQVNEIIDLLLVQVGEIISYDTGTLWLRQNEQMTIRAAHGFDDTDRRVGLSISISESALLREMIENCKPLYVGDVSQDVRFPSLVKHHYRSWLGVPLLSKDEVIGVIALEKVEKDFYSIEHIQAVVTFAGQAAVALENAKLYEESVRRTIELDERSQRLSLLNRLSTALSGSLDIDHILVVAIDELNQAVKCSAICGILFDSSGKAFLRTQRPKIESNLPQILPESPLFDRLRESLGVFSTEDISQEEVLNSLKNVLARFNTRSLLALPLATGNDLHGLLFLIQEQSHRFSPDEVELARTISNQAAVAIQNAHLFAETERLFSETRQISAELATLFEIGVNITQVLDQRKLLNATFQNSLRMMHADSVALVVISDQDELILEAIDRGERIGPTSIPRTGESLSESVLISGQPLLVNDFEKERDNLPASGITVGEPIKSWLGVPLIVRGNTVGVISAQSYRENAFGDAQLRLLSQVGNQLAVALDNARLFETVQTYAADLEERVSERTQDLEKEHQRLQMLLNIIAQLSSSLDLDIVLNRALAVINETVGSDYSHILLYRLNEPTLYTRATCGVIEQKDGDKDQRIKTGKSLAEWVISKRQPIMSPNLSADSRWESAETDEPIYYSVIAVPLVVGEEVLGAMQLYHHQINHFTSDQLELVQATAKQIAVAINNAQLFHLIRDQAERLGEMLRMQHIETSRSHAILEAVADGVLVTDSSRTITLFNASAEKMLDLDRDRVVGRKLEHFSGLFGKQSNPWVKRIRTWSENTSKIEQGEVFDEQIDLDDGRVISVHVSPVILRNDFLGTVSIFRDITHMIELDRLKSEFVATVSHELRTPMTSIKGYVEILLMGAAGQLNEQQTHFLEIVKSNTERLAVLVNDLLDISRIEAGRVILSLQPLDLHVIVDEAVEMIKRRMQEENRPMEIILDIPRRLHSGYGDQERVQQIFENLLENAYQYTPENGRIQLNIREESGVLQIDIKDNGIGIFPDDVERVFERFYRGEDPLILASSGTGLGLSIVKHLVEMHGGRIWAESTGIPGEGSTFSFTLPVYDPVKEPEFSSEFV